MFEIENTVILVATLLALFIIIFQVQRNALKQAAIKHDLELLELARALKYDESQFEQLVKQRLDAGRKRQCSVCSAGFLWQLIFGMVVLLVFAGLTVQLLGTWWAVLTAVFAALGLLVPFDAWIQNRQIKRELERLSRAIDSYEAAAKQQNITAPASTGAGTVTEVLAVKSAVAQTGHRIPEDSVLRRHFISHLRSEIAATLAPRPTDSTLRRHHDAMLDVTLQQRLEQEFLQ